MKICGFIQVYNELEKGNLKRCINNLKKYCNYIAVFDDGSIDNSIDYLKKEGCSVIRGDRNDFRNEIKHYQLLLNFALNKFSDIDWFFQISADEILSRKGIKKIRKVCEDADKETDGFSISQVNLWRGYNWYRTDFYQQSFVRLWRNKPDMKYNIEYGLHHQQYPNGINNILSINDQDIKILHYGFITDELLLETYKQRVKLGTPVELAKMRIDETDLQLNKVNLDWFPQDVEIRNTERPVKKFFGILPENFKLHESPSDWRYPFKIKRKRWILSWCNKIKGKGIELGCGHSRVSDNIFSTDIKVSGKITNDLEGFISEADMISDARNLDFPDNTFDFIISSHLIEHLKNGRKVVNHWIDKLKKNGILIIVTPDARHWKHSPEHVREYTPNELKELFDGTADVLELDTANWHKTELNIVVRKK